MYLYLEELSKQEKEFKRLLRYLHLTHQRLQVYFWNYIFSGNFVNDIFLALHAPSTPTKNKVKRKSGNLKQMFAIWFVYVILSTPITIEFVIRSLVKVPLLYDRYTFSKTKKSNLFVSMSTGLVIAC